MTWQDTWEQDIRDRLRTDMSSTLRQHLVMNLNIESLTDALVEDAMHQVYKAAEEGRP